MTTPVPEIVETPATPTKMPTPPKQGASADRVADKHAEALRAKKKKKRAAHRVALRRSHANG
ncbi:MAG TPA: hypothetical protein VIH91_01735 [Terriglobales bacterium]